MSDELTVLVQLNPLPDSEVEGWIDSAAGERVLAGVLERTQKEVGDLERVPAALTRQRRSWVFAVAAGVAVVLAFGLPAWLLQWRPDGGPVASPLALGVEYVWPEGGVAGDAEQIAREFAQVLEWSDALVSVDPEADPSGPVWVRIQQPGRDELSVLTAPLGDENRALFQVGSPPTTGVEASRSQWIGLQPVEDAVTADVHVRMVQPDRVVVVEAGTGELQNGRILINETSPIASVLIIYRDRSGGVINASGGHYGPIEDETTPTTSQTTTTTPTSGEIDLEDLGAPVLFYGPSDHDALRLVDRSGERVIWPGPTDVAIPDGSGGVILKPATEPTIVWVPDIDDEKQVLLVTVDGELLLRGILQDGRVLYSVRPHPEGLSEESVEEFFAVGLAEDSEPEQVGTSSAYESWAIGPVWLADGEPIHGACHLHCSLWPGLTAEPTDAQPLYHGGGAGTGPSAAIEGLGATPDGRVVGFVEFDIALPEASQPELVLLDGATFDTLARVELRLEPGKPFGSPVVSISADGQRILVSLGAPSTDQPVPSVPTTPYIIDGALTGSPQVLRIDAEGALRWFDPARATNQDSP